MTPRDDNILASLNNGSSDEANYEDYVYIWINITKYIYIYICLARIIIQNVKRNKKKTKKGGGRLVQF